MAVQLLVTQYIWVQLPGASPTFIMLISINPISLMVKQATDNR